MSKINQADPISARELCLWGTNCGELYASRAKPVIANLARKMAAGAFDETKAPQAFAAWADATARSYTKEFGCVPAPLGGFSVATRRLLAAEALAYYEEHIADAAEDYRNAKRWTLSVIRDAHTGHFFDRATMRFFGDTMAHFGVECVNGGVFVVRIKASNAPAGKRWRFDPETGALT